VETRAAANAQLASNAMINSDVSSFSFASKPDVRDSSIRSLFADADSNNDGFVDVNEFGRFVFRHGLTFQGRDPVDVFGDFGKTRWYPLDYAQFENLALACAVEEEASASGLSGNVAGLQLQCAIE
jgi:hypothetical protein